MRAFLLFLLSSISVLLPSIAYSGIQCDADRFSFSISMPKGYLSGVLITNESDDSINGSMINEFGISAVDFTYSRRNGKFRLVNVISFLDKWHIRRMLGNDLRFCLRILKGLPADRKGKYQVSTNDNSITVVNLRRKISYSFTPLETTSGNDTE